MQQYDNDNDNDNDVNITHNVASQFKWHHNARVGTCNACLTTDSRKAEFHDEKLQ